VALKDDETRVRGWFGRKRAAMKARAARHLVAVLRLT
jgi:hypothetical protein